MIRKQAILRIFRSCTLSLLFLSAMASVSLCSANEKASFILVNARIYTMNARQPWAEALAITGDKIVAVGTKQRIEVLRGPNTQVIDAKGRLVLPAFTDSHIHFLEGSRGLTQVDLTGADSVAEIQKRVKEYAAAHPTASWIRGRGWTYDVFGAAALPDRKILDDAVSDRPVYLVGFDGHTSWVNSKALATAGITRATADPSNGQIVKDANGEPTGVLKESADDLMESKAPRPTREEQLEALRLGMREANRVGLARVHSASNSGAAIGDLQNIDLYEDLRRSGQLTVRMYLAYGLEPPTVTPKTLAAVENARKLYHDDWISAGAVKFFLDGVIESHTAAMLTPYSDDPKLTGRPFWDEAQYKQAVQKLDARGIQIFTHAIGDRAVRLALDAYEGAAAANHTTDHRHRIEHIETITAQDIPRLGKIGVIASFQPLHSYPDDDTLKVWAVNAGPERASRAWAWKSIAKTGGRLAFGSDWPVVTLNPWYGVQNAVTRQTRDGKPEGGWVPSERISLEQAIEGYTLGAAFAGHREKLEGSLEEGKLADLIVLDQDLFKIATRDIYKTEVLLTMVGGKVVYQSPAIATAAAGSSK